MRTVICFIFLLGIVDIFVLGGMGSYGPSNYWQQAYSGDYMTSYAGYQTYFYSSETTDWDYGDSTYSGDTLYSSEGSYYTHTYDMHDTTYSWDNSWSTYDDSSWSTEGTHYTHSYDMYNTDYSWDNSWSTYDDSTWSTGGTHYTHSYDMSDTDYSWDNSWSTYDDSTWSTEGTHYTHSYDMSNTDYSWDNSWSTYGDSTWSTGGTHYTHSYDMSDTDYSWDNSWSTYGDSTWSTGGTHYTHSYDMSDTDYSWDNSGSTYGDSTWSTGGTHYTHSYDMSDTDYSWDNSGSTYGDSTWSTGGTHYTHSYDMSDTDYSWDNSGSTYGDSTWSTGGTHYTHSYDMSNTDNSWDNSGSTYGDSTWSTGGTHYTHSYDMSDTDYSWDNSGSSYGDSTWSTGDTHYTHSYDMSDTDYSWDNSGSTYGDSTWSTGGTHYTHSYDMSNTDNSWDNSGSTYGDSTWSTGGTHYTHSYDMSNTDYSLDGSGSTHGDGTLWSSESIHYTSSFDMSDTDYSFDGSGSTHGDGTLWSSENTHYTSSFDMSDTDYSFDGSGSTHGDGTLWSSESTHYTSSFDMSDTDYSFDGSGSTHGDGTLWSSENTHYTSSFDMSDTDYSFDGSGSTHGDGTLWSSESTHYTSSFDMSDTDYSFDGSGSTHGDGTLWSSENTHYTSSFDMSDTDYNFDGSGSTHGDGTLWSSESTHYTSSFDMSDTDYSLDGSGSTHGDGTLWSSESTHYTSSFDMSDTDYSDFYDDSTFTGDTFSSDYMTSYSTYFPSATDYINPTSTSFYTESSMSSSVYYDNIPDDLSLLNVSFTSGVEMVGSIPKVALYCTFNASPPYEYEIKWLADDALVYTSDKMSYALVGSFFVTRDDMDISGFALDKSYKCAVSVYNPGGSNSIVTLYSEEGRPIQFNTTHIELLRGEDATFNISINIPFPCPEASECYLDVKLFDPDEDHDCYDSSLAFINTYTCGQRISGSTNYSSNVGPREITVTTKNNQFYYSKSSFRFRVRFDISGEGEDFWSGTFSQEFTVSVSDDNAYDWMGAYCYATNDPRMSSFDRLRYSHLEIGDFIMYRHTEYEAEVQMTTEYCMWAGTCACGVHVRAGKDVFVIDHCDGLHFTNFTHTSGNGHLYVTRYYGNFYVIYLPHGTIVYVGVSPRAWFPFTMLNIFIFPSPADIDKVEGLCGTLNDNSDDDFTHRDGTVTPVSYAWPWWRWWQTTDPTDFIESWRVPAEERLMNSNTLTEDLNGWNEDNKCVCTGSDGSGSVMCSTQEQRLCNTRRWYGGVEITRRSVNHKLRSRMRKAREIQGNILDRSYIQRRLKLREERRAAMPSIRAKRQAEDTVSCDFETAYNICASGMASSCGSLMGQETGGSDNSTDVIINCALDKQENCTVTWEDSACSVVVSALENTAGRNNSLDEDEANELLGEICPNQCCGHGNCDNGECSCDDNYAMDDCGLDKRELVEIILEESGENVLCDKPCTSVPFVVSGITEEALCKLLHYRLTLPENTIDYVGESVQGMNYFNTYEGECVIPNQRRRRSVSSGSSVAVDIYQTSVSNDGTNYGSSKSVIVLDSTCLTYSGSGVNITATLDANYCLIEGTCYLNGTSKSGQACAYCDVNNDAFGWTLQTDYCLIDDECYTNGTLNSGDACKFCDVSLDTSDWTDDNETASCQVTSSDGGSGMEGHVIAIIVLAVLLGLACIGGISYAVWRKWKRHKALRWNNRGLFDHVSHPKFLRHVEPTKFERMDDNVPRLNPNQGAAQTTTKWKIGTGLHGGIKKPNFLLQTEASSIEPIVNPSEGGNNRGIDNRKAIPTLVLPQNSPEGGVLDHPPPMYKVYSEPKPGTEKTPTNLYTEREKIDLSREPSPVEASSVSRKMSTGHMTPEGDVERANTPTMPDIGQ